MQHLLLILDTWQLSTFLASFISPTSPFLFLKSSFLFLKSRFFSYKPLFFNFVHSFTFLAVQRFQAELMFSFSLWYCRVFDFLLRPSFQAINSWILTCQFNLLANVWCYLWFKIVMIFKNLISFPIFSPCFHKFKSSLLMSVLIQKFHFRTFYLPYYLLPFHLSYRWFDFAVLSFLCLKHLFS